MIGVELVDVVVSGRVVPGLDVLDRAVFLAAQHPRTGPLEPRCEHTGKLTHASEVEARRFAFAFTGRGHVRRGRPYVCPLCGGWHLSTRSRRR